MKNKCKLYLQHSPKTILKLGEIERHKQAKNRNDRIKKKNKIINCMIERRQHTHGYIFYKTLKIERKHTHYSISM